jgi:hypothetical protein
VGELRPGTLADGVGELRPGTLPSVWRCEEEDVDFNAMVQTSKHESVFIGSLDSISKFIYIQTIALILLPNTNTTLI